MDKVKRSPTSTTSSTSDARSSSACRCAARCRLPRQTLHQITRSSATNQDHEKPAPQADRADRREAALSTRTARPGSGRRAPRCWRKAALHRRPRGGLEWGSTTRSPLLRASSGAARGSPGREDHEIDQQVLTVLSATDRMVPRLDDASWTDSRHLQASMEGFGSAKTIDPPPDGVAACRPRRSADCEPSGPEPRYPDVEW